MVWNRGEVTIELILVFLLGAGAYVAQVSSAFGMHLFSILGIPVSTSSAIVGAVVGVGLVRGLKAISKRTILTILIGWVLTPTLAAGTSFLLYKMIDFFVG